MTELLQLSLPFRLKAGNAVGGKGKVQFLYCSTDPYAVHFSFPYIAWRFDRDMLAEGINDIFGGDSDDDEYDDYRAARAVLVEPVADGVEITFRDRTGLATLLFDRDDLIDALDETWKVVERGREHEHLDVDAALESLLKAGA